MILRKKRRPIRPHWNSTGEIVFTTPEAIALWRAEIAGQLSDGAWENASPRDHWRFWCNLESKLGPAPKLVSTSRPTKINYGLSALISIVGDRMLSIGRIARALHRVGMDITTADNATFRSADELIDFAPTFEEFLKEQALGKWSGPVGYGAADNGWKREMIDSIPLSLVAEFYKTTYTLKDLRNDLRAIKASITSPCEFYVEEENGDKK